MFLKDCKFVSSRRLSGRSDPSWSCHDNVFLILCLPMAFFLFNALFAVDCVDLHYILCPNFLLAVSPLALCLSSPFPLCLLVHHCAFWQICWSSLSLSSNCYLLPFHTLFLRYSPANIGVGVTCCLVIVMMQSVFIPLILYFHLLWSSNPCPITVQCINGPPLSCCSTTVDLVDKKIYLYEHPFLFYWHCLFLNAAWLLSTLTHRWMVCWILAIGLLPVCYTDAFIRNVSVSLIAFFHCSLYGFNACLCLLIALVVAWW